MCLSRDGIELNVVETTHQLHTQRHRCVTFDWLSVSSPKRWYWHPKHPYWSFTNTIYTIILISLFFRWKQSYPIKRCTTHPYLDCSRSPTRLYSGTHLNRVKYDLPKACPNITIQIYVDDAVIFVCVQKMSKKNP